MIGRPSYVLGLIVLVLFMAPTIFSAKEEVEAERLYMPVELQTETFWTECGEWNGLYYPALDFVILCNENMELGVEAARFVYLHELGHAFSITRDFEWDRWGGNYEAAADEFAAVQSVVRGHPDDLLAMARAFDKLSKDHPYQNGDPHPPLERRAATLRTLYWSHFIGVGPVGAPWREAFAFWKAKIAEG